MEKEQKNLKENDNKLLAFCMDQRRSVNDIARFLNVAPSSVVFKIKKLEGFGLIIIDKKGKGKKTYVRTKKGNKIIENYLTLLKEINEKKGVTEEKYSTILDFDPHDPKEHDRFSAMIGLPFVRPKLIQRKIFITKEGEEFLKEHSKKK